MFESNLLTQINVQSPLPTFVEVRVVNSLNTSLYKAFQFAHVLLAEKSPTAAGLLPWTDEIYYTLSAALQQQLLSQAGTTFTELLFGLRRGQISGPAAAAPSRPWAAALLTGSASDHEGWWHYIRWILMGPVSTTSPEERAMSMSRQSSLRRAVADTSGNLNVPHRFSSVESTRVTRWATGSDDAISPSALDPPGDVSPVTFGEQNPSLSVDPRLANLNAKELFSANRASYGHLRFRPLRRSQVWVSLILVTLKPYLDIKLAKWYAENSDDTADAVALREAYAARYPKQAAIRKLLVKYIYPLYHCTTEGTSLLFQILYLLELTPYPSFLHRLFGIALRRNLPEDALAAPSPRARVMLVVARVLLLLIFFGFQLLEFTRNHANNSSGLLMGDEDLSIPPPPVWGTDIPVVQNDTTINPNPLPGICPVCASPVTNAAVCTCSGVVGCYPCMQNHVRTHHVCPVSGKAATAEQIRRIYEC